MIPVDFAGLPCDWRELRALADRYGFSLPQDASHATGASYRGAPAVGSAWADASVFSFHAVRSSPPPRAAWSPRTTRPTAADLRLLRSHGMTREPAALQAVPEGPWVYEQQALGFNCRMTELQAALGRSQLKRLDSMHERRLALAAATTAGRRPAAPARTPRRPRVGLAPYAVEVDRGAAAAVR